MVRNWNVAVIAVHKDVMQDLVVLVDSLSPRGVAVVNMRKMYNAVWNTYVNQNAPT